MVEYPEIVSKKTNINGKLESLCEFNSISLDEMDEVKLLNRYDSKYWFEAHYLPEILKTIKEDYYILEIDSARIQAYNTIYFDTPGNHFYIAHHNGKSNRLKIRKRKYVMSGISFLEIKEKNNKGKTNKIRMPINNFKTVLSETEKKFIRRYTLLNPEELDVKFGNSFRRITLINKNFNERCTIDINLRFHSFGFEKSDVTNLAIIELKQGHRNMKSKIVETLKHHKIYEQSFSKYCMGRALNELGLKKNRFKANILKIERQFTLH